MGRESNAVTLVATVRLVVAAIALLGVTVDGANVQVLDAGSPEQEKLTCWLKPKTGVTLTVVVPDCPAEMVMVAGFRPTVKAGVPTDCVSTADVDPVKLASPL